MHFVADLRYGEQVEDRVALAMAGMHHGVAERPKGKFSAYDIRMNDGTTIEVKSDRRAGDTGNFFVEFQCSKKPSGLDVSTATYWVLHDAANDAFYKVPRAELRALCVGTRQMNAGNGWRSRGHLLPVSAVGAYRAALDENRRATRSMTK